ncbi:FGGY family carbohydrate kinase [Streptomyces sp. RP5T]|uniref:FGGY family carbohydrate kinase n=1 Tax=Streptomyces sp. RP5T TaxID=2490848 RepID=UPI000F645F15|nr:FGGY family carbohydrate kinase [Streptomyces sp. RP5T]RRR86077.1 carbohydrate kinase [Streptomyces sp. RP5T]
MTENVLAIDQGTSGTKAIVVCPERGVIGRAEATVRPAYGSGGSVEQDPGELLESVVSTAREAVRDSGESVGAIGLANQGETVLAWDRTTGKPLTPALGWQDRRAATVCDRLADRSQELTALTGLPLDPYFAGPKMTWLREQWTREGVVTTSDAWLLRQLTGRFVTDAATASRTQLMDLDSTSWSDTALSVFGLDNESLPEIVDCAGAIGETEILTGDLVPVTAAIVDQPAALFGHGLLAAATAKCTYGTGAFLVLNQGTDSSRSTAGLTASVAWRLGGTATYSLDGQVYTAASAVRWLVDLGLIENAADLDRLGGSVPDSGGVVFLPALAGLGAPQWQPQARGSLTGLALETTAAHVVRALVEGIAAQVAVLVESASADTGRRINSLRVDGGLTRSALLMQAQADLLQVPVEVDAAADTTALGVAALAAYGIDPRQEPGTAVPRRGPAKIYEPRIGAEAAQEQLDRFRRATEASVAHARETT